MNKAIILRHRMGLIWPERDMIKQASRVPIDAA